MKELKFSPAIEADYQVWLAEQTRQDKKEWAAEQRRIPNVPCRTPCTLAIAKAGLPPWCGDVTISPVASIVSSRATRCSLKIKLTSSPSELIAIPVSGIQPSR